MVGTSMVRCTVFSRYRLWMEKGGRRLWRCGVGVVVVVVRASRGMAVHVGVKWLETRRIRVVRIRSMRIAVDD